MLKKKPHCDSNVLKTTTGVYHEGICLDVRVDVLL